MLSRRPVVGIPTNLQQTGWKPGLTLASACSLSSFRPFKYCKPINESKSSHGPKTLIVDVSLCRVCSFGNPCQTNVPARGQSVKHDTPHHHALLTGPTGRPIIVIMPATWNQLMPCQIFSMRPPSPQRLLHRSALSLRDCRYLRLRA